MAVAGLAFGLLARECNDYNNSIQYNTGATLTEFIAKWSPGGSIRLPVDG